VEFPDTLDTTLGPIAGLASGILGSMVACTLIMIRASRDRLGKLNTQQSDPPDAGKQHALAPVQTERNSCKKFAKFLEPENMESSAP